MNFTAPVAATPSHESVPTVIRDVKRISQLPQVELVQQEVVAPINEPKKQEPVIEAVTSIPVSSGDPQSIAQATLASMGMSSDWTFVDYIFSHESTWNPYARNALGCIGLGQSCPGGSGLATDCVLSDIDCQVRHFTEYANRYGGWSGAYSFWLSHHWW